MTSPDNPHTDPPQTPGATGNLLPVPSADDVARREESTGGQAASGAPLRGYETRDVNSRAILWLGAATFGGTLLVMAALALFDSLSKAAAKRRDPQLSPLAAERAEPPGPHLQQSPIRDYAEFRAAEEAALDSYGWVDKEQKVVRIPVSRAMDLLLERGLPEPEAQSPEGTDPTTNAPKLKTE